MRDSSSIPVPLPILQMLGLPRAAVVADVVEEIRSLQRLVRGERELVNSQAEALRVAQERLRRAENPEFWRAVWTGDLAAESEHSTALTHGNYVELMAGTGQVLMVFHPCCQNLSCRCDTTNAHGHCLCHENDE